VNTTLAQVIKQAPNKRTPGFSLAAVQEASSEPVYRRGVQYYRRKKVLKYEEPNGDSIDALVIGSEPQPYKVTVQVLPGGKFKAECSCPYFEDVCKHSVAVLLTYLGRRHPGMRFDLNDGERGSSNAEQHDTPRAREFLDDARDVPVSERSKDITMGLLIIEKPLALIVGLLPDQPQGKVNILKVPPQVLPTLEKDSRIWKLARYLTALPQTTKGLAGGHRITRGDEGYVLGHLSLCAGVIDTTSGEELTFSDTTLTPRLSISENESGELKIRLLAVSPEGTEVDDALFLIGHISWVLSNQTFYPVDLGPIQKLFSFFDSSGNMTVKLDVVPRFLAVDLPALRKKVDVVFDEHAAPFPIAVTEPPRVVIRVAEKEDELEVALGFAYGSLVLPSRDETSAVESELYTRSMSESGQSVWIKRLWDQEAQVRLFLSNLQPEHMLADRFYFTDEAALDAVFYLSGGQSDGWQISGLDKLSRFRVNPDPLAVTANMCLNKEDFKFSLDLNAFAAGHEVPFEQILDAVFGNHNYLELPDGEHVRLHSAELLNVLKAVGANNKTSQDQSLVRPLYQALPITQILEAFGITIEPDQGFKDFIDKLRNLQHLTPAVIDSSFEGSLREYQKEGYSWLSFLREYGLAGILADDMGLGKTIQTLVLLLSHHKPKREMPSLVIAPTSVVYNWMSESQKFTPELKTALYLGRERGEILDRLKKKDAAKPDLLFTTYGILRRDYEILKELQFEYVILDEAQNIKNPESVGAIASKSLKSLHRLALTGTPVENRLKELWSLFDFLMSDYLGNYRDFNETFERPIEAGTESAGHKLRKIVHPFVLRRLKSQVEKELPERVDIINLCELDDDQRSLYLDVLDECRKTVFGEIATRGLERSQMSVLTALLRLRQVCCDPRLLKHLPGDWHPAASSSGLGGSNGGNGSHSGGNGNGSSGSKDLASGNVLPESAKLGALLEMVDEVVDEGHKILIFSQFVEMLSLIRVEFEKMGLTYEYIDGQTPAKDRLDKVNRFNADTKGDIPVFLISLKAGGTGLNLTGADYVIHYDPWWNPAVENQATDRAHRIGQTRRVFNYKLITRGTVEEKILQLQNKKKRLADLIIGGDEGISKELTREDLEFLFSF
jgi:SNF2 family DNA or RNA helicase